MRDGFRLIKAGVFDVPQSEAGDSRAVKLLGHAALGIIGVAALHLSALADAGHGMGAVIALAISVVANAALAGNVAIRRERKALQALPRDLGVFEAIEPIIPKGLDPHRRCAGGGGFKALLPAPEHVAQIIQLHFSFLDVGVGGKGKCDSFASCWVLENRFQTCSTLFQYLTAGIIAHPLPKEVACGRALMDGVEEASNDLTRRLSQMITNHNHG